MLLSDGSIFADTVGGIVAGMAADIAVDSGTTV